MKTRHLAAMGLLACAEIAATAAAEDPAPIRVDLHVTGASFAGEGCEGGDWTLRWRGELPSEGSAIDDMLISYSAFDTTIESGRADPPAQIDATPLICKDKDGNVTLSARLSGGERRIRGVVQLKDDPAQHSPGFIFSVDDAGNCQQRAGGVDMSLPSTTVGLQNIFGTTLTPTFQLTRKDLEEGFEKRYSIGGLVLSGAGLCMTAQVARGELTLKYKRNETDPSVSLAGCAALPLGQSTTVAAVVEPRGGTLRFSAEPGSAFAVRSQGLDAQVSASAPGKGHIKAEYTYDGKSASAEISAAGLQLKSINGGAPIPKLGLLDIDGLPNNKVYTFPFDLNPPDAGDMISFALADSALASVVTSRSSVGIQTVREGRTTLQARTQCGQPLGEPVDIEIVTCDDEVKQELTRQVKELKARESAMAKRIAQLVADAEFQRAGDEIRETTGQLAVKSGELIAATLTGAEATAVKNGLSVGKTLKAVEAVQTIWDVISATKDFSEGKVIAGGIGAYAVVLNTWASSALKSFIEAGLAAEKFGKDLGIISGVVEQLEELEPQHDAIRRELYRLDARQKRCDNVAPPPPLPPRKDGPRPPETNPVPPASGPSEPSPVESTPVPVETTPTETPPEIVDPVKPPLRGAGLCIRPVDNSEFVASEVRDLSQSAAAYRSGLRQGIDAMSTFKNVLAQMKAADTLAEPTRSQTLSGFGPALDRLLTDYFKAGDVAAAPPNRYELCTFTLPPWMGTLRTRY